MPFDPSRRPGWADPFAELRRVQDELNRTLGGAWRTPVPSEFPPINLWTGEQGAVLKAVLPGVLPEDLDVTVHQDTVTLKGQRRAETPEPKATFHRRERRQGSFGRTVALPFAVMTDQVEAKLEDGILTLLLPRHASERPTRIQIKRG